MTKEDKGYVEVMRPSGPVYLSTTPHVEPTKQDLWIKMWADIGMYASWRIDSQKRDQKDRERELAEAHATIDKHRGDSDEE